jgi:hypothetical protein
LGETDYLTQSTQAKKAAKTAVLHAINLLSFFNEKLVHHRPETSASRDDLFDTA